MNPHQINEQIDSLAAEFAADPAALERHAEQFYGEAAARTGLGELHWPLDTRQVETLLADGLDYRLDSGDLLSLMTRGIASPKRENGRLKWTPVDVADAQNHLEANRLWKATPRHFWKMSIAERDCLAAAERGESAFHDLDQFTLRELLLILERTEQGAIRHLVRLAVETKLRAGETL